MGLSVHPSSAKKGAHQILPQPRIRFILGFGQGVAGPCGWRGFICRASPSTRGRGVRLRRSGWGSFPPRLGHARFSRPVIHRLLGAVCYRLSMGRNFLLVFNCVLVVGCAEKRIVVSFGSSPSSITVCAQYVDDAYEQAQGHCAKFGKNAELVDDSGRSCKIAMVHDPTSFNFRCVKSAFTGAWRVSGASTKKTGKRN